MGAAFITGEAPARDISLVPVLTMSSETLHTLAAVLVLTTFRPCSVGFLVIVAIRGARRAGIYDFIVTIVIIATAAWIAAAWIAATVAWIAATITTAIATTVTSAITASIATTIATTISTTIAVVVTAVAASIAVVVTAAVRGSGRAFGFILDFIVWVFWTSAAWLALDGEFRCAAVDRTPATRLRF